MTSNETMTIKQILENLRDQECIRPEETERISERLSKRNEKSEDPWYIRILVGTGAWFAGVFLWLFCTFLIKEPMNMFIAGSLILTAATFMSKADGSVFFTQFATALAITGNNLILASVIDANHNHELAASFITQIIVCAGVYPFYSGWIYRFLCITAIPVIAVLWVVFEKHFGYFHALVAVETVLAGFLLLYKKRPDSVSPLYYAVMIMLPVTVLILNLTQVDRLFDAMKEPLWPSSLILSSGLAGLLIYLDRGFRFRREPWMVPVVLTVAVIGSFTTPGILVAAGLLIAGYATFDKFLTALAHLFMVSFLILFYYTVNIDLAAKSFVIAGTGIVLLVARMIVVKFMPAKEAP